MFSYKANYEIFIRENEFEVFNIISLYNFINKSFASCINRCAILYFYSYMKVAEFRRPNIQIELRNKEIDIIFSTL